ncbi:hypothetical protein Tco_1479504 [Tanacetum coccineum]
MSTPTFAETHNLAALLEKPEESNGFDDIIDFLNASSIKYALMVNPIVYELGIQQFWAPAKANTVNRERQIQALVDKKKVIITEKSVRSDLMLEDAEGTECLPNDVFFEQLTLMGAKTTAWNEFSSTMASAIILFMDKKVDGMSKHEGIYVAPSYTKKSFANMKREGKGFSGSGNIYSLKDKNEDKTNKTEHMIGMSVKSQTQRRVHLKRTNPHPFDGPGQPTLK